MPKAKKSSRLPRPTFSFLRNVKLNQVLYVLLLVSTFLLGYLLARVQSLENGTGETVGTQTAAPDSGQPQGPAAKVDVKNGHLPQLGENGAKVTIVEFSDFQCPFCRKWFTETYEQLKTEYIDTGKVKLYYRHYPLDNIHPAALPSAIASECANDQGKFWEFHDLIYNKQEEKGAGTTIQYTNDDIKTWVQDLGIDSAAFNECLDSEKHKDNVTKDQSDGSAVGVNATPTFFVNGRSIVGAQPFSNFKTIIDEELK